MFSFIFQGDSEYEIYTFPAVILGFAVKAVCGEGKVIGLAMRTRNMRMRMKNLIHIIHIWIFAKNGNFLGQKWVSLALFSILSAQNIIIVHPTWFYPSSGMKNKSPESQYFGQKRFF